MSALYHWVTANGWTALCMTAAVGIPLAVIPATVWVDRWLERRGS